MNGPYWVMDSALETVSLDRNEKDVTDSNDHCIKEPNCEPEESER